MSKQIRVAIFHNEYDSTKQYAEQLAAQINAETKLINFRDPYPCAEVLPMRASPNVALLLFADSLEEMREPVDILAQLGYIRNRDTVTEIINELIESAEELPAETEAKIANTFFGGSAV
ncbi:hypothetical protein [Clostridium minihomine]|uniref:hypothetical protein n=1 Tax=Clostridium minihomine TaxID=2045012 RepID=UPI000C787F03|nr:hypothetical protein [Clostridium minihomine]